MLNHDQQVAKDIVDAGGNLLIHASAGYGKTYLADKLKTPTTLVSAPTGASALVVGGVTNHRLFNAPLGCIKPDQKVKLKPEQRKTLLKAERIIFDEISMTRFDMFQYQDKVLREVKEVDLPFGGVQIIGVGDFYQLSPFTGADERDMYRKYYGNKMFPFESECWNLKTVELTQPMRNTNSDQLQLIQDLRRGAHKEAVADALYRFSTPYHPEMEWIHLCAKNNDVDAQNIKRYKALQTSERVYIGETSGSLAILKKDCRVGITLALKVGMRIMTVLNDPNDQFVNGSTGTIVQLEEDVVIVQLDNGTLAYVTPFKFDIFKYVATEQGFKRKEVASLKQFPLVAGWSISINKSQGATLDNAVIDLGYGWVPPAGLYVASTRVRNLANNAFKRKPTAKDITVNALVASYFPC